MIRISIYPCCPGFQTSVFLNFFKILVFVKYNVYHSGMRKNKNWFVVDVKAAALFKQWMKTKPNKLLKKEIIQRYATRKQGGVK